MSDGPTCLCTRTDEKKRSWDIIGKKDETGKGRYGKYGMAPT